MQIVQQLWIVLRAFARLLWLIIRQLVQWSVWTGQFVYTHRQQIVQYRYTVPLLMLFSILWAIWQYNPSAGVQAAHQAAIRSTSDENHFTVTQTAQVLPLAEGDSKFRSAIDQWMGTPHRNGLESKAGTDCSGFVRAVFWETYGLALSRNSEEMFRRDVKPVDQDDLQEGDLVFFNTYGRGITHVGIYLNDNKFVHTSTSRGVTVDSLGSPYYQKNYYAAGRVKAMVND